MAKKWLAAFGVMACVIACGIGARVFGQGGGQTWVNATTATSYKGKYPVFEVDQSWPKLPNGWIFGLVSKVAVDSHDNVWIIHRPRSVAAGKTAAPAVVEFDANGKFVQAWGGDSAAADWPEVEHNIFVDAKDNVFISGTGSVGTNEAPRTDDMILKFTKEGKLIKELGGRTKSHGSTDPNAVNKPGDLWVSARTNEVYVADGYGNRRVIVYDADTLAFKRMWGAFGKPAMDDATSGGIGATGGPTIGRQAGGGGGAPPKLETEGPGPEMFASPVHGVMVSNDNIVYVLDRSNRRMQLFTPEGKFIKEVFVNRAGPAAATVCGLAFSPDKDQQFLYLSDYGNSHIVVMDRKTLEILYQFGKRGTEPGNFQGVHHMAVDSKGNIYTAEVAPGARAQKFVLKGMSATVPANALSAADLSPNPGKP